MTNREPAIASAHAERPQAPPAAGWRPVRGLILSALGIGLAGLTRFTFNIVGLPTFGEAYIGSINPVLSNLTIIASLLSSTLAVMVSKFVPEYLGASQPARAHHAFGLLLLIVAGLGAAGSVLGLWIVPDAGWLICSFVTTFSLSQFLKAAYYAFRQERRYFEAELLSSLVFFAVFLLAWRQGSERLATASLVAAPTTFVLLSLFHLRRRIAWAREPGFFRNAFGSYTAFYLYSQINVLHGLSAHHVIIVVSDWFLTTSQVAYLSVLLAALGPLHQIPQAMALVLSPEMARRFGARDASGEAGILARSVLPLLAIAIAVGCAGFAVPGPTLAILGVPQGADWLWTWNLLLLVSLVAIVSTPCSIYLNVTRHIRSHAGYSVLCLILGAVTGPWLLGRLGPAGASLMRGVILGLLALIRFGLIHRLLPWAGALRRTLTPGLLLLLAAAAAGASSAPPAVQLLLGLAGVALLYRLSVLWRTL
jgi:O-antigen/teichoic acid export membrane protein